MKPKPVLLLAGELNNRRPQADSPNSQTYLIPITADFDELHRQGSLAHFRGEVPSRGLNSTGKELLPHAPGGGVSEVNK